jgi:hypothetical protein
LVILTAWPALAPLSWITLAPVGKVIFSAWTEATTAPAAKLRKSINPPMAANTSTNATNWLLEKLPIFLNEFVGVNLERTFCLFDIF